MTVSRRVGTCKYLFGFRSIKFGFGCIGERMYFNQRMKKKGRNIVFVEFLIQERQWLDVTIVKIGST
jgi:hypothetical protein